MTSALILDNLKLYQSVDFSYKYDFKIKKNKTKQKQKQKQKNPAVIYTTWAILYKLVWNLRHSFA